MFEILDTNSVVAMVSFVGIKMPFKAFVLGMLGLVGTIAIVLVIISQKLSHSKEGDNQ